MDTSRRLQQAESISIFREGIGMVLFRWSALRTAVENDWGGRDSRRKAEQIGSDVLSWFTQSKDPLYIDDLEGVLDEGMLSLNVEVDDGSIEEVAEKLMIMHEECLEGNFRSIDLLREAEINQVAHPHVTQVMNDDNDESDDDNVGEDHVIGDDNSPNMMVDVPKFESHSKSVDMSVNGHASKVTAEDGWVVVSNRRNKGRKN